MLRIPHNVIPHNVKTSGFLALIVACMVVTVLFMYLSLAKNPTIPSWLVKKGASRSASSGMSDASKMRMLWENMDKTKFTFYIIVIPFIITFAISFFGIDWDEELRVPAQAYRPISFPMYIR